MSKSETNRSHRLLRQAWDKARREMTHTTDFVNILVRVGEIIPDDDGTFVPPSSDWEQELVDLAVQACKTGEIDCEVISISFCAVIEAESHAAEISEDRIHILSDTAVNYDPWNSTITKEDLEKIFASSNADASVQSSLEVVGHGKDAGSSELATCSKCVHLTPDHPEFDQFCQDDLDADFCETTRVEIAKHVLSNGQNIATLSAVSDCEGTSCNAVLRTISL